jgi:recombination associated protein RdgC
VFKNVMMYRLLSHWTQTQTGLETALEEGRFTECGGSQEKAVGWVPPRGKEHGPLVEIIAGQWMFKLMVEVKVLPGTVVKRKAQEQLQHIEATTGRKPGKKEAREIQEGARLSLLPMAFTKQATVLVWIDPEAQLLVLDAGSQARADEVMTCLIKAIDGLAVQLFNTQMSPAAAMAIWLSTKEAPQGFTVDRECELKAADESKAVVRYTRHALDTEEVTQHIAAGKVPTKLALTWNDHVSFMLTEAMQLKKVAVLDVVFEGAQSAADGKDDDFDTDVTIATGELRQLIPDLLEALGGEVPLIGVPLA